MKEAVMEQAILADRLVPKVHPASREVMPDDPMSLCAMPAPGDPDLMIRAVVGEYAWLGWGADQIAALFDDPFYPMLHGLRQALGEAGVRERIDAVFARNGVYRFRATVAEAVEEPRWRAGPDWSRLRAGEWTWRWFITGNSAVR
jgi:hypothetical protein